MKKFIYKYWSKFLTAFGNVKIFKYPFWLVYDPDLYEITGEKTIQIFRTLKPGDIVFRGYNNYLDGKFVPSKTGWSHGGIYVGEDQMIHAVAQGVSQINVIDFVRCDRIAILRPRKHSKSAIKKAKQFLKDQVPYDFGFKRNTSSLYCFELCGECYEKLNIERYTVKKFFGLMKRKGVYLAESFFTSDDFTCVFQYNPKYNVDFVKA